MRYFSAFAGIGGFDEGIKRAVPDAECIGYSEVDKYAIKIYERHFPDRTNYGDIRRIEPDELPDFDMLCGGFPCQDLSIAGKRAGLQGERSGLFFEVVRIIREKQPRLVFLENVKGLLSSNEGWDFARILVELEESGYDVEWQVLNSKNFGVPQNRERVFIIGHLRGEPWKPVFPIQEANGLYFESTANCLDANYHKGYLDHGSLPMIQVISHAPRCGDPKKGGTGLLISSEYCFTVDSSPHKVAVSRAPLKFLRRNQRKYEGGDYSFTVDGANTGGILVNSRIRRLTPLECERLQGFPDNWTEGISDTQRYKCLGNAVTVNVIEAIARRIEAVTRVEGYNLVPV